MSGTHEERTEWRDALQETVREGPLWIVDRVEVVEEARSTQDTAFELAAGRAGLLLCALHQTAGRGRLGRAWAPTDTKSLAMTVVLDGARFSAPWVSLAAGVAVAQALPCHRWGFTADAEFIRWGLRWPNDIVEPEPRPGGGRKVGGVLIEVRDGLALLGIGINVNQEAEDFPADLRGSAVSLRQVGEGTQPPYLLVSAILRGLRGSLVMKPQLLAQAWARRDVLVGSHQTFVHDRRRVSGVVLSIDPAGEIVLQTGPASQERLPAATTSLVH